jgi:hypothetical protein
MSDESGGDIDWSALPDGVWVYFGDDETTPSVCCENGHEQWITEKTEDGWHCQQCDRTYHIQSIECDLVTEMERSQ